MKSLLTDIFDFLKIVIVFEQCIKVGFNLVEDLRDTPSPTSILLYHDVVQRSS